MKEVKDLTFVVSFIMIVGLAHVISAQTHKGTEAKEEVVAVINENRVITQREVDGLVLSQLYNLQERVYSLRMNALESLIIKILIEEEAKAQHLSVGELRKQLVPEAASVKEAEVEQVYEENFGAVANMNEDEAKQRIRLDLEGRQKLEAYKKAVTEMRRRAKVAILLPEPVLQMVDVDPIGAYKGDKGATVTIIEFSDFQCPYCKQASHTISDLLPTYGDKVKLVFKHLPLPIHPEAFKAAQASICALEQRRFWDYHDRLFAADDISAKQLTSIATDLGLNMSEFQSCLDSERGRAAVLEDIKASRRLGIQATPTFLINGRLFKGALSAEDLKLAIDKALQKSRANGKAGEAIR